MPHRYTVDFRDLSGRLADFNDIDGCHPDSYADHRCNSVRDLALPFHGHGPIKAEVLRFTLRQLLPCQPAQNHFARVHVLRRLIP